MLYNNLLIVIKIFAINLYHHSYLLATALDFTTFSHWPFWTGLHLFLQPGCFWVDHIYSNLPSCSNLHIQVITVIMTHFTTLSHLLMIYNIIENTSKCILLTYNCIANSQIYAIDNLTIKLITIILFTTVLSLSCYWLWSLPIIFESTDNNAKCLIAA